MPRKFEEIDAIASTAGPGLIVCLSVGLSFGKAFAAALNKPFIAVNHLEGHALSPKINKKIEFPYLLLLISGGHTQFLQVNGVNNYKRFSFYFMIKLIYVAIYKINIIIIIVCLNCMSASD